jgi:hypothetical protein
MRKFAGLSGNCRRSTPGPALRLRRDKDRCQGRSTQLLGAFEPSPRLSDAGAVKIADLGGRKGLAEDAHPLFPLLVAHHRQQLDVGKMLRNERLAIRLYGPPGFAELLFSPVPFLLVAVSASPP